MIFRNFQLPHHVPNKITSGCFLSFGCKTANIDQRDIYQSEGVPFMVNPTDQAPDLFRFPLLAPQLFLLTIEGCLITQKTPKNIPKMSIIFVVCPPVVPTSSPTSSPRFSTPRRRRCPRPPPTQSAPGGRWARPASGAPEQCLLGG